GKGESTMSFHSWLQNLRSALTPGRGQRRSPRRGSLRAGTQRPHLEILEDRCVPASSVWGDFNNDGIGDLVTGLMSAYEAEVSVHLGHLNDPYIYVWDTGWESNTVVDLVADDFDADGNLDLAASVSGSYSAVSVLLGNGQGWFPHISQLY